MGRKGPTSGYASKERVSPKKGEDLAVVPDTLQSKRQVYTGRVSFIHHVKKIAFIKRGRSRDEEIFLPFRILNEDQLASLRNGIQLTCEYELGKKGPVAVSVISIAA